MFSSTYATIEEAWGVAPMHHIENPYKEKSYQHQLLETRPETPKQYTVRQTISSTYKKEGLVGLKKYLDPVIIRDIQSQAVSTKQLRHKPPMWNTLDNDESMYLILGLVALLFIVDM